jgi:hypothetical protein
MSAPGWADCASVDLASATDARTTRFCRPRPVFAKRLRRAVHARRGINEDGSSFVRLRAVRSLTGKTRPAITCAPNAAASTASHPNVRDDGQRPSSGQDGTGCKTDLGQARKEIFFKMGLDRESPDRAIPTNHTVLRASPPGLPLRLAGERGSAMAVAARQPPSDFQSKERAAGRFRIREKRATRPLLHLQESLSDPAMHKSRRRVGTSFLPGNCVTCRSSAAGRKQDMKCKLFVAAAVFAALALAAPASARLGTAPGNTLPAQDDAVIQVKGHGHGHGHMHRGGRGHHYGWGRGRGHHYGWRHHRRY